MSRLTGAGGWLARSLALLTARATCSWKFHREEVSPALGVSCYTRRIPRAIRSLRRLIRAPRRRPATSSAKTSHSVSFFIPAVRDQCSGMFSDTRSIFRCLRGTRFSLFRLSSHDLSAVSLLPRVTCTAATAFHSRARTALRHNVRFVNVAAINSAALSVESYD